MRYRFFICLFVALAIGSIGPSFAQTADDPFCPWGCPAGADEGDTVVRHHILVLSSNPETKFADWVAYVISDDTIGHACQRPWRRDPDLDPAATLAPADYAQIRAKLQSDRGHQAPLASLCGSRYWREADYLSNITPQKTNLNEGAWERLEDAERDLVADHHIDAVYSVTGPLYEHPMRSLPRAHLQHRVPSGYWKVIAIKSGSDVRAIGFIMEQGLSRDAEFCEQEVDLTEIEERSGLQLFPLLSQGDTVRADALRADLDC